LTDRSINTKIPIANEKYQEMYCKKDMYKCTNINCMVIIWLSKKLKFMIVGWKKYNSKSKLGMYYVPIPINYKI